MTLNKLYGHQHELVDRYDVSLSKITKDIFAMSETGVYHFTSSGLLNTKRDLFQNMTVLQSVNFYKTLSNIHVFC